MRYFLKIPATSVVRFMFTCKTYYALLSSDRGFAEAHRRTGKLGDCKAIVVVFNRALSVDYNLLVTRDLNLPQTEVDATGKDVKVIGSCRDLVCMLECSKNFILWNPTTGAFRKIPITLSPSSRGYDSLRCDHRLVVICNHLIDKDADKLNHCILDYSLKNNSVNCTTCPGSIWFCPRGDDGAVYFNHHLHWDDPSDDLVLTYNLEEGTFGHLPLPDIDYYRLQGITVIKDSFGASFYSSSGPYFAVWFMREYNVRSSWTLTYKFEDHQHWDYHRILLDVSDDGSLVIDSRDKLSIVEPTVFAPSRYRLTKRVTSDGKQLKDIGWCRSWIYEEGPTLPCSGEVTLSQVRRCRTVQHQGLKAGTRKRLHEELL